MSLRDFRGYSMGSPKTTLTNLYGIYAMIYKIAQVYWIKAHMTPEEATARGYTLEQVQGNDKADELAKKGRTCTLTRGTSSRSTLTDFE